MIIFAIGQLGWSILSGIIDVSLDARSLGKWRFTSFFSFPP